MKKYTLLLLSTLLAASTFVGCGKDGGTGTGGNGTDGGSQNNTPAYDASKMCGDGKVQAEEKCDTKIKKGEGACISKTACLKKTASDASKMMKYQGSKCTAECVEVDREPSDTEDGYCKDANDTDWASDADCIASKFAAPGGACKTVSDCQPISASNLQAYCKASEFPDGLCLYSGCNTSADCGPKGVCMKITGAPNVCLQSCELSTDCRTTSNPDWGYVCGPISATEKVCIAGLKPCENDSECSSVPGLVCRTKDSDPSKKACQKPLELDKFCNVDADCASINPNAKCLDIGTPVSGIGGDSRLDFVGNVCILGCTQDSDCPSESYCKYDPLVSFNGKLGGKFCSRACETEDLEKFCSGRPVGTGASQRAELGRLTKCREGYDEKAKAYKLMCISRRHPQDFCMDENYCVAPSGKASCEANGSGVLVEDKAKERKYCKVSCDKNADCPSNFLCAEDRSGEKVCMEQCASDKDCIPEATGNSCQLKTVGSASEKVCDLDKAVPQYVCKTDDGCKKLGTATTCEANGSGLKEKDGVTDQKFCKVTCAADADCMTGFACVENSAQEKVCMKKCADDTTCSTDDAALGTTCLEKENAAGAKEKVCAVPVAEPQQICETKGECRPHGVATTCEANGSGVKKADGTTDQTFCKVTCAADTDCLTGFACVENSAQEKVCMKKCADDTTCSTDDAALGTTCLEKDNAAGAKEKVCFL